MIGRNEVILKTIMYVSKKEKTDKDVFLVIVDRRKEFRLKYRFSV